jgi:hypothetical protein
MGGVRTPLTPVFLKVRFIAEQLRLNLWPDRPHLAHSIRSTSSLPVRTLETDHPCVRLLRRRMKIIHPAKPDPTIK